MRNAKIKAIRHQPVSIPFAATKAISAEMRNFEEHQLYYQIRSVGALGIDDLELPEASPAPMHKVELEVEGAMPEGNFADVWVDGEQLMGVTLDEKNQLLSGYLSSPPGSAPKIEIELPDGTRREFLLE